MFSGLQSSFSLPLLVHCYVSWCVNVDERDSAKPATEMWMALSRAKENVGVGIKN